MGLTKRCPKCRRSYPEEAQMCDDCDQTLVPIEEYSAGDKGDVVPLTTVPTEEEAMVIKNALEAEGIPALIEDLTLLFWTQGVTPGLSGVRVMVNSEDAEAALELLEQHRRGELSLNEDEDPEPKA